LEIIGDVELLARSEAESKYVGITGTNGKSTTTSLIGHILKAAGKEVEVGGNLGTPALSLRPVSETGIYVLEMSSYQLELAYMLTFEVAVLLNISPDHLDRHGGMDGYLRAKKMIFRRQGLGQTSIIGVDDDYCRQIYKELKAGDQTVIPVSGLAPVRNGVYAEGGLLIDDTKNKAMPVLDLTSVSVLPGVHNWQNAAAAYAVCRALGVDAKAIAAGLQSYPGLAHRQERVAVIDGITYINDSKATNPDSAARALACYDNIYWIAGGRAKEAGLADIDPHLVRVRHVYLIGESAADFAAALKGKVDTTQSGDLASAINQARLQAVKEKAANDDGGAVVLLSPAAASFDQFRNFEDRGDVFRALVESLPGERGESAA
ncbi:MAG: UDP-N-acetylmuramoyl-L-alanine--D-glutamate ligase, partial [Rhodospirillales bacterium]|nr:UDP-N-acetylmuramoyl-L-alanine--D-glutamate ligase [Rhodospirillales bacterium]